MKKKADEEQEEEKEKEKKNWENKMKKLSVILDLGRFGKFSVIHRAD